MMFALLNWIHPIATDIDHSKLIYDRHDEVMRAFLTQDDKWRMKTELDEISPELQKAIIFKEDKYFYYHFGINPLAIVRALYNNVTQGRRTSGASTITMQVARMLHPKARTYRSKFIEMFRALQLELYYSKKEILQLYLNLVPYGGNIEGVKSASQLYFEKAPEQLSLAEITALSIIPNRPTSLKLGEENDYIREERNKWLKRFKEAALFPEEIIEDALLEPLIVKRHDAPQRAMHFSTRLKYQHPYLDNIKSTIDLNQQIKVEQLVKNYVNRLRGIDVHNAAVLVVDNETAEVIAYVGSADFYNESDAGQVDGIRAWRSPGSTLKPLIYGLAFDEGHITTHTQVSDVPVNYAGYSPGNYKDEYKGSVTIKEALAQSLNIPAVVTLDKMGHQVLIESLISAGFQSIQQQEKGLGLAIALGGCSVSLEELTGLYTAFSQEGSYRRLRHLKDARESRSTQLLSPSAAYIITDMMTGLTRPDFPESWRSAMDAPHIAWKTGTSYGRKDAWSIGYNKKYTVGIWTGNFSGRGVPELTGSQIATPLLFDVFKELDAVNEEKWFAAPDELKYRWVCSSTGDIPTETCDDQILDLYLPMVSAHKKCRHTVEVHVSADESHSFCPLCLPDIGYKKKSYPNLAAEIISYYDEAHIHYEKIPAHHPDCEKWADAGQLEISSPTHGISYLIDPEDNTELMLYSHTAADVQNIYWYLNETFYATAAAGERLFFSPSPGENLITCVDDRGRKSEVKIKVEFLN